MLARSILLVSCVVCSSAAAQVAGVANAQQTSLASTDIEPNESAADALSASTPSAAISDSAAAVAVPVDHEALLSPSNRRVPVATVDRPRELALNHEDQSLAISSAQLHFTPGPAPLGLGATARF